MLKLHKAGLATALTLTSITANAGFKEIEVTNFEGQYRSPQGTGVADSFSLPLEKSGPIFTNSSRIEILKSDKNFELSVDEVDYLWQDAPTALLEMESVNWSDINFNTLPRSISLSIEHLHGTTPDKDLKLSRLSAQCQHSADGHESFVENLLETCLNGRTRLRIDSFDNEDKALLFERSELTQFIHMIQGLQVKTPSPEQSLEDIQLDIQDNSFEARLKTKIVFNTTVKAEGKSFYDSDQRLIRLRIDKAKAGFLNVKDRIFEELEKKQSETLRVEKPWIFVRVSE